MNAKKILALIIALAMVFALAACGKKAEEPAKAGAPVPTPASQAPAPAAQTPGQTQPADTQPDGMASAGGKGDMPEETLDDRLSILTEFLYKVCPEMAGEYDECDPHFDLVFLDDDDLPELVIAQDWYHAVGAHFYMVVGGNVKEVDGDNYSFSDYGFGQYGSAFYKDRGSIIESGYYGMGALSTELFSVDEEANITPLKSWYEYEDIDWDNDTSEFVYMVDGEDVDKDTYEAVVAEWSGLTDKVFEYSRGLSYLENESDINGALYFLYYNPADYSGKGEDEIAIEDIVGAWKLVSYDTEGYEALAEDDGLTEIMTFYDDWTVDIYEQIWNDKPLELKGVELFADEYGYLNYSFCDTRLEKPMSETPILMTVVGLDETGLHISSTVDYGDGTYGGSYQTYERVE